MRSCIETLELRRLLALPTPWLEADIGSPASAGSGSLSAGTFTVRGAGDMGGNSDQLHYAYQRLSGDGYVIAQVSTVLGKSALTSKGKLASSRPDKDLLASPLTSPLAAAGVMIREDLSPNSKFADMVIRPGTGATFQYRLSTSYKTYEQAPAEPAAINWIKLVRTRNTLSGYTSADGQQWTLVSNETIAMSADAYIGLAVSSNSSDLATSTFTNVVIPQNILHYGATVDSLNNVPFIQAALTASGNSGNEVYVPPGTYKTAQMVELTGAKRLFGAGRYGINPRNRDEISTILATNVNLSPIHITGSGGSLNDIALSTNFTGERQTADRTTAVYADTASNFVIDGVEVLKSASGGFMISHGAHDGVVTNNRVHDTLADGIHMTNGSYRMLVENNVVYHTGDDLIAAVGYDGKFDSQGNQWAPPTDITIRNNVVTNTGMTNGRGIAAVGAKNVLIDNNTITDAPGSGIIIVSENAYSSLAGDGITATRNRIINPNTTNLSGATGNHGGIYIGGRSGFPITNVLIGDANDPSLGNTITNAKGGGVTIASFTSNIRVFNNSIDQTTGYGLRAYDSSNVSIGNNIVRRSARQGLYLHNVNSGTFSITNNVFENINTSNTAGNDAIYVAAGGAYSSLTITGNSYTNPLNYVVDRFIECHFAAAIVNGNTTNTGKSTYVGA